MPERKCLEGSSAAFRLLMATSWLAPESWRGNQEERIREAMDGGPDWTEYLSLVDRHQVPALSWAALSRVEGVAIPEYARREMRKRSEACRIQGLQRSLVLAEVLKEFNRAGIPAMALKGPALSMELYGDVGLRASDDLDLQVRKEDLARAMACLESAGWHTGANVGAMSRRQWQSYLRNDYEVQFAHARSGCSLELHWRSHWEDADATNARWARSKAAVWQGCALHEMSAGDLTLYLCVHGAYHIWSSAKWLGDVARAQSVGLLDWGAAEEIARSSRMDGVCPAAQCLLHRLYGFEISAAREMSNARGGALLVEMPLETLELSADPRGRSGMALLRNHSRMIRYERLVRPRKGWWESVAELFYCQQDFRMLPIPDGLFWLYKPLRPILWVTRWAAQAWRQAFVRNELRAS